MKKGSSMHARTHSQSPLQQQLACSSTRLSDVGPYQQAVKQSLKCNWDDQTVVQSSDNTASSNLSSIQYLLQIYIKASNVLHNSTLYQYDSHDWELWVSVIVTSSVCRAFYRSKWRCQHSIINFPFLMSRIKCVTCWSSQASKHKGNGAPAHAQYPRLAFSSSIKYRF